MENESGVKIITDKKLIVFAIDENYIKPFIVALESFFIFNSKTEYEIGLIYSSIKKKSLLKIKKYAKKKEIKITTYLIDDIFKDISTGYHFNSVVFYRLLIPKIFQDYKKVLYIDADVLFVGNIDDLFKIDLGDNILAAIPRTLDIPEHMKCYTNKYFISGLLLLNIQRYNEENILEKAIGFLQNSIYDMPDQDALNAVVKNWSEIDLKFGNLTAFLESNSSKIRTDISNQIIIQFYGSSKPWHFRNRHPYKKLYWKHLKMTPFYTFIPEDLTIVNILKWIVPKFLKQKIKDILRTRKSLILL